MLSSSMHYIPLALPDLVHEQLLDRVGGLLHGRGQDVDIPTTQRLDLLQQLRVTKGHGDSEDLDKNSMSIGAEERRI